MATIILITIYTVAALYWAACGLYLCKEYLYWRGIHAGRRPGFSFREVLGDLIIYAITATLHLTAAIYVAVAVWGS